MVNAAWYVWDCRYSIMCACQCVSKSVRVNACQTCVSKCMRVGACQNQCVSMRVKIRACQNACVSMCVKIKIKKLRVVSMRVIKLRFEFVSCWAVLMWFVLRVVSRRFINHWDSFVSCRFVPIMLRTACWHDKTASLNDKSKHDKQRKNNNNNYQDQGEHKQQT